MQIGQFGSKNFFFKNMQKMNLQEQLSCSVQKTNGKNSQYSKNETILKIDHFDRTITRLLEGILFICGPSSIICARAERGCK